MAYETGTATDAQDWYDKLETFLTANVDLVAATTEWTVVWTNATNDAKVFRATGAAGGDSIYVGMQLVLNVGLDQAYVEMVGMTGYISSATDLWGHVNVTPVAVRTFLDFSPFTYWWTANGRRLAVAHKISTVYQAAYAGFMLPYVLPTSYPDPVLIGGMCMGFRDSDDYNPSIRDWRSQDRAHSGFWDSARFSSGTQDPGCYLLDPSYLWKKVANWNVGSTEVRTHPYYPDSSDYSYMSAVGSGKMIEAISDLYGGDEWVAPITYIAGDSETIYGALDGFFHAKGIRQNAESVITVDGDAYLVIQNVHRTGRKDYVALRLT